MPSSTSASSAAPKKRGPKSHKSDGSRKQRWSAAERSERGRPPRRSAGRAADDRRPAARSDERPARTDRAERGPRTEGADRFARTDRADRTDRPRSDRPRTERPRTDRPSAERPRNDWRPSRDDRRPAREDRSFRRPARDDHEQPSDQMSWTATEAPPASVPVSGDNGFARLGVPAALVQALAASGISEPFPIQAATIPDALAGRDVLGRGRTGSGKTLGFGLPMLARLAGSTASSGTARGIVLVPTRELALQVADVLAPLARTVGLSVTLITGGMAYGPQLKAFSQGVDIAVATPGRLIDLLDQGAADLSRVEITVLDEADHMADLGFLPAVTQILDTVPGGGQRLLFSATLDSGVDRVVKRYLSEPVTHETDPSQASVSAMAHHLVLVRPHDKVGLTAELAGRPGRTVAFVRTQRGADRVAEQLRGAGVMAGALHGGLTQGARARILAAFKDGKLPVLVATDVAARGIHVDDVGLVLQVDPPAGPKDYLHRAGRTARAGEPGTVVTLTLPHQRREVRRLAQQAGVTVQPIDVLPGDDQLVELGAQSPSGVAIEQRSYEQVIAPPQRVRSERGARKSGFTDRKGRNRGPRGR